MCEALSQRIGATLGHIHDKNVACKTSADCEIASSAMCNLSVDCGSAVTKGKREEVERQQDEATRAECKT